MNQVILVPIVTSFNAYKDFYDDIQILKDIDSINILGLLIIQKRCWHFVSEDNERTKQKEGAKKRAQEEEGASSEKVEKRDKA